jgi:2,4-dienoyl-CoA reductase-like NADH-dependent reductase (Old Yellow Enzyme family)/thioredoxin reductase
VTDFPLLLSAASIGTLSLPNRVILPAMDMNHCDEGMITTTEVEHYSARAAGGCALVITGASAVSWPIGATSRKQPGLSDDRFLPGLRALADGVHRAGGRVCVQLCHHGKTASVDSADGRPQLVPNPPPDHMDLGSLADNPIEELMRLASASKGTPATYRSATADDLAWVAEQFADAAARVQAAGCDAVEVHGAHGYLISTFLSAAYNLRTDEYGGSLENRSRLLVEVLRAVRQRVGATFPIIVRLNGCEYGIENGITPEQTAATARIAESAGADAIHVSANAVNPFRDFTLGPLPAEVGQYRAMAAAVKRAVKIPVIAVGRLLPEVAEAMLAAGECDFVSMGRQQLADAELVHKLVAGKRASIRPCINCYVCVEQNFFDSPPRCAVNTSLGNEPAAAAQLLTTVAPRHVVVVGGGPGGLETARIAAQRGHRVTLLERSDRIGGTMWFSQLTTPANEMLVNWLTHEVTDAGVDIRLASTATVASVRALNPDVVVVATGAKRDRLAIPGGELDHVRSGDEMRALITGDGVGSGAKRSLIDRAALAVGRTLRITKSAETMRSLSRRWMPLGKHVVIVGGGLVGLELAEFLAERDRSVTVLEAGPHFGLPMAMPRRWNAVIKTSAHGVNLIRNAQVVEITRNVVRYQLPQADGVSSPDVREVQADDVIIASEVRSDQTLADELRDAGLSVHVVGDAAQVGYIEGAMHSAHAVAVAL